MKRTIFTPSAVALALLSTGCDVHRAPEPGVDVNLANEDNAARTEGENQAEAAIAATRLDTLEARVATLENDVDALKARQPLPAISAPAALPAAPPPLLPSGATTQPIGSPGNQQ